MGIIGLHDKFLFKHLCTDILYDYFDKGCLYKHIALGWRCKGRLTHEFTECVNHPTPSSKGSTFFYYTECLMCIMLLEGQLIKK